jgi:hypothetical protein
LRQPDATSLRAGPDSAEPASENHAQVALDPVSDPSERQISQHYAPFLAQLVATKDQHPQTRERRRAGPNEALAAYWASVALTAR